MDLPIWLPLHFQYHLILHTMLYTVLVSEYETKSISHHYKNFTSLIPSGGKIFKNLPNMECSKSIQVRHYWKSYYHYLKVKSMRLHL